MKNANLLKKMEIAATFLIAVLDSLALTLNARKFPR